MSTPTPFIRPAVPCISWAGYLSFLQNVVRVPAASMPPPWAPVTPSTPNPIVDNSGNPITDSNGNLIIPSGSSGAGIAVIDSSGGVIIDSSGNDVLSSPYSMPPQVWSLATALEIVNETLAIGSFLQYTQAVYNLAADRLINFTSDPPNTNWFEQQRALYKLNAFAPGVVQSGSDESTSSSLVVPEQMKEFTLFDLQTLKTPWGRNYMAIAQQYGQSLWGLD